MTGLAERLARPEVAALKPFDLAPRDCGAFGQAAIRLDANESPFAPLIDGPLAADLNRYPEPQPLDLRSTLAALYGVADDTVLLTRGGDDAIDILIRAFCRPQTDAVLVCPPTFSAYAHFARLQGARVLEVQRTSAYAVDVDGVIEAARADESVRIVVVCTPNNPTGDVTPGEDIRRLCEALPDCLVLVDAAYAEFQNGDDITPLIGVLENLVILRTLSKAWGLASIRLGALIGDPEVIGMTGRALPPYPLPGPAIAAAMLALSPVKRPVTLQRIETLKAERDRVATALAASPWLSDVRSGGGNFLFLVARDAEALGRRLASFGVRARFRPSIAPGVLRLTIGMPAENDIALQAFEVASPAERTTRNAVIARRTNETDIAISLDLDQSGPRQISTGVGFFDHMVDQIAAHGGFALLLTCAGDLHTDPHHTVEDCALALGSALKKALGTRKGIRRFGFVLPMDDAEASVSLDLSGRPFSRFDASFEVERIGDYPTALTAHVFRSLADSMGATIHVRATGEDDHHKTEACFKAFGRALRDAIRLEGSEVPSTKGVL